MVEIMEGNESMVRKLYDCLFSLSNSSMCCFRKRWRTCKVGMKAGKGPAFITLT